MVVVPAAVLSLNKQRDPVIPVSLDQKIVVDLKGALVLAGVVEKEATSTPLPSPQSSPALVARHSKAG